MTAIRPVMFPRLEVIDNSTSSISESSHVPSYGKIKTDEDQPTEASTASSSSLESIIMCNNITATNIHNYSTSSLGSTSISSMPGVSTSSTTTPPSNPSERSSSSSIGINSKNNIPITFPYSSSSKANLHPFQIPQCPAPTPLRRVQKRKKNLTVIENFIMGWKRVKCNESITYTTHGDYRYLDNLVPLVERWNGPIFLALYCPGLDMLETLKIISYFKLCTSSKINEWVTFHLIYDVKHMKKPTGENYSKPGDISWLDTLYQNGKWTDCTKKPSLGKGDFTFRMQNNLLYPINIARNIARSAATTHFVLASDIELYPSINLIPSFMGMLRRMQKEEEERINYKKSKFAATAAVAKILFQTRNTNNELPGERLAQEQQQQQQRLSDHEQPNRHVYVLPVFEVKKEISPCQVETKQQLATLLKNNTAVLFHHSICPQCHTFPKFVDWKGVTLHDKVGHSNSSNNNSNSSVTTMRIFHKAKRKYPFHLWEPIFIGTKEEPIYDERLSWEGLRDKMVSGYVMCVLDYDFFILDSAFLVHKPGIGRVSHLVTKTVMSQDRLINYRIRSELLKKFGKHDECAL